MGNGTESSTIATRIQSGVVLLLTLCVGWMGACQEPATVPPVEVPVASKPKPVDSLAQLQAEAQNQIQTPLAVPVPLPPLPPGLENTLRRIEGESLVVARKSLADVLEELIVPAYLKPRPNEVDQARPPRRGALKAYVLGRSAWRRGRHADAVRYLEAAHRADPKSPQISRLLGWVYFDAVGGEARGSLRLQQAVALEQDSLSLLLLGRYALSQRLWSNAIILFDRAKKLAARKLEPEFRHLLPYYQARALLGSGNIEAAMQQLQELMAMGPLRRRSSTLLRPFIPDVAFVAGRTDMIRLEMADGFCRMGQYGDALEQYRAATERPKALTQPRIAGRLAYAAICSGRPAVAQLAVIEMLRAGSSRADALSLVSYVAKQTSSGESFIKALGAVYEQNGRSTALALAVFELMDSPERWDLLIEHLASRPEDHLIYRRLAKDMVSKEPGRLLRVTVDLMSRRPQDAELFARELARHRVAADQLLALIEDESEEYQKQAPTIYLRGVAQRQSGRMGLARKAFERSIQVDPTFPLPKMALVDLEMQTGHYDEALALLADVGESDQLLAKRAEAYMKLRRYKRAGDDIKKLRARKPNEPAFAAMQGRWLFRVRKAAEAEELLKKVVTKWPKFESGYAALFDVYERRATTREELNLRARGWAETLAKARLNLPESRVTRAKTIRRVMAAQQYAEAEKLCNALLHEFAADGEVKGLLAQIYTATRREAQATKLLADHISLYPDDYEAVLAFEQINETRFFEASEAYWNRQVKSLDRWLALFELFLRRHRQEPDGGWQPRAISAIEKAVATDDPYLIPDDFDALGELYGATGKLAKAAAVYDRAIKRFPESTVDLLYQKSNIYSAQRDYIGAEKVLVELLKLKPDHDIANNDLGYFWAVQGRNLDQALAMTKKAVALNPTSGAYLDSLGWVHYMLGDFSSAIKRLEQAVARFEVDARAGRSANPSGVIADHLGDAMWRNGDAAKAVGRWEAALVQAKERIKLLKRLGINEDPDVAELVKILPGKISVAKSKGVPKIAKLPASTLDTLDKKSRNVIDENKKLLKKIGDPAKNDWWQAQLLILDRMGQMMRHRAAQSDRVAADRRNDLYKYIQKLKAAHPKLGGAASRSRIEEIEKAVAPVAPDPSD